MKDIVINLIATGIAFLAGLTTRSFLSRVRRARLARNRRMIRQQRHPRFSCPWLIRYYDEKLTADDLYGFQHESQWIRVPFVMKSSWNLRGYPEDELLRQEIPQLMSQVSIDRRALKRRSRYMKLTRSDGEVWNEYIACVFSVEDDSAGPRIHLGVAEYFQFLSACGPLEDETFRSIGSRRRRSTPLRDRVLSSADVAAKCRLGAHAFGMQVAVVFDTGVDLKILIQRRSHAVSLYGGALAVVPVFGCQTVDLTPDTEISLFHNFLREIYEELYGGTEIEQRSARVDPRWFYREAPIAHVRRAHAQGVVEFELLGFGFDALNGEMDLMALTMFKKSRFSNSHLEEMKTNWEIHDIHVWSLFGSDLTDAILAGEFSPGSVYALTQVRERLHPLIEARRDRGV